MFKVETRDVPAQQVLCIQDNVAAPDLAGFIREAITTLYDTAGESAEGSPLVIYHGEVSLEADGPVEVCVPHRGGVEPAGLVNARVEDAHREAFTRITKRQVAFPEILEAYEAVHKWIVDHGLQETGSPREVYFVDWNQVGENDPACDIAFPISP